jgi:Mrp family chromosome partitioning ATPase
VPVPVSFLPEVEAPSLAMADIPLDPGTRVANDSEIFGFEETLLAIANLRRARIAAVSPGGDPGSPVAWEIARLLAEAGNSVIVIDLTGSAVTSREFLGTAAVAGIAELMARSATLADTVFADRRSPAHIIPAGREQEAGPGAMAELARVAATVSREYNYVVIDCGFAGPEGLENIADEDTIVIVSAEGATRAEAMEAEAALRKAGYRDAVTVRLDEEIRAARKAAVA